MTRALIERLTLDASGAASDGATYPAVLPGETVEPRDDGTARIVMPSSDRVVAPCPHFPSCGGCALQHASDQFVAGWKTHVVARALEGQGLVAPIRPILSSPPATRCRAKLSGRRTKKGALVGFHSRASHVLIAVPGCRILDPILVTALPALEALVIAGGSRKGEVDLTVTASADGVDVAVTRGRPLTPEGRATAIETARRFRLARLSWQGEEVVTLAAPAKCFGSASVVPPPGAFLQATPEGEAALVAAVVAAIGPARQVADLFAGCGTFALPLAAQAEVHAVEADGDYLAALDSGWRQAKGLKRLTTERRDLFRRPLLSDELRRFDAVVIDPPRAGAPAQTAQLAAAGVPRIASVSCNPVTFARDAKVLTDAGYRLDWVQPVDQFRWSPHVELAAQFTFS